MQSSAKHQRNEPSQNPTWVKIQKKWYQVYTGSNLWEEECQPQQNTFTFNPLGRKALTQAGYVMSKPTKKERDLKAARENWNDKKERRKLRKQPRGKQWVAA